MNVMNTKRLKEILESQGISPRKIENIISEIVNKFGKQVLDKEGVKNIGSWPCSSCKHKFADNSWGKDCKIITIVTRYEEEE